MSDKKQPPLDEWSAWIKQIAGEKGGLSDQVMTSWTSWFGEMVDQVQSGVTAKGLGLIPGFPAAEWAQLASQMKGKIPGRSPNTRELNEIKRRLAALEAAMADAQPAPKTEDQV